MVAQAPTELATTPAESAHPELWQDALLMPLFGSNIDAYAFGSTLTPTVTGFAAESTSIGRGYGQRQASTQGPGIVYPVDIPDTSEITVVFWFVPDTSDEQAIAGGYALAGCTTSNADGYRVFAPVAYASAFGAQLRWRVPQAAGNVDANSQGGWAAGDLLQAVFRLGSGSQGFIIYNATTDLELVRTSKPATGFIDFNDGQITLGNINGGTNSFPGTLIYGYQQNVRWTDQQIVDNRADPFAAWRKASGAVLQVGTRASIVTSARLALRLSQAIHSRSGARTASATAVDTRPGVYSRSDMQISARVPLGLSSGVQARGRISTSAQMALSLLARISTESAIVTTGQASLDVQALFSIASRTEITTGCRVSLALDMSVGSRSDMTTAARARVALVSELGSVARIETEADLRLALRQLVASRADIVTRGEWQTEIGQRILYLVADGLVIEPVLSASISIDPLLDADGIDIKPY